LLPACAPNPIWKKYFVRRTGLARRLVAGVMHDQSWHTLRYSFL
jgi:hypothetical protein